MITNESRRDFLKAAGGLTLGLVLPEALAQSGPGRTIGAFAGAPFTPNAFVRIGADNTVTVIVKHLEMGQGTYTGLPTLVAEELDADWSQIRAEGAPADAKQYNNLFWGPVQGTGGSSAMANSWAQLRKAGATARAMLRSAAAEKWGVPAESLTVDLAQAPGRGARGPCWTSRPRRTRRPTREPRGVPRASQETRHRVRIPLGEPRRP